MRKRREAREQGLTSIEICFLLLIGDKELLFLVKALGDVLEDSVALPDDFIIV